MARPRKNRIGEYAALFGEELERRVGSVVRETMAAGIRAREGEIAKLRADVQELGRKLDALARKPISRRSALGRWVPGGPGRPPKDAAERIAAFADRSKRKR